jgi:HSP20 family molecular chaperone IbpA
MNAVKNDLITIFENLFGDLSKDSFWNNLIDDSTSDAKHYYDNAEQQHVIVIPAAGFKKEDINIESSNNQITFKGEMSDEKIKKQITKNNFHYILRKNSINIDTIKASLENGILTVKFKTQTDNNTIKVEIN